jgi:hypothetical protein
MSNESDELYMLNILIYSVLCEDPEIQHLVLEMYKNGNLDKIRKGMVMLVSAETIMEYILYAEQKDIDEIKPWKRYTPELDEFYILILKTIVRSRQVVEFIYLLNEREGLDSLNGGIVDIFIDPLIGISLAHKITQNPQTQKPRLKLRLVRDIQPTSNEKSFAVMQYIDGVQLTRKEEKFEEYCIKLFDEEDWLKKHKLTLQVSAPPSKHCERSKTKRKTN